MDVWNTLDLFLNIVGIIYIIFKEDESVVVSKKNCFAVLIAVVIYVLTKLCFSPFGIITFCLKIGINVLIFGILHKIIYKGSLLNAICKGLIVYQIYRAMLLTCLGVSYGIALTFSRESSKLFLYTFLYLLQVAGMIGLGKIMRRIDLDKLLSQKVIRLMTFILSITILFVLVGALNLAKTEFEYLSSMFYILVIIFVLVGTFWLYDKQSELKAQKKLEDENIKLAAKVHKTKEIIPAVALELQELNVEELASDSRERFKQLLEEMKALQNTYVGDSSTGFVTQTIDTGYRLLNRQLEGYIMEAADKHIEFMVMMRNRPKEMNITLGITQGEIQQLMGDVVRNAIRAIERIGSLKGRILLCFGYLHDEEGYVLEVYDNGAPFPRDILEHFGTRGMTTGGTGHGLADIVDVVEKYGGKVEVEQLSEDIYSKVVRIWLKRAEKTSNNS